MRAWKSSRHDRNLRHNRDRWRAGARWLTQALAHVPPARAADASGLLTTTVQLGQLMGVAVLGSVYLSRAATHPAAAMAGTAAWLAALSAAALPAALVMVRGVSRRSASS